MVGASKILTVSYGTFSCTLEGFDDPFSTMKAIAEYFRDLAADDRYFGAEPPTPDAQMLHQIAEREVHRRVEAKIQENGVVLRADADAQTVRSPAATTPQPQAAPAQSAAPQSARAQSAAPHVASPMTADPEPGSVAAKLLRIRAAVVNAREGAAVAAPAAAAANAAFAQISAAPAGDDYVEDEVGTLPAAPAASSDTGFPAEIAPAPQTEADARTETVAEDLSADDEDVPAAEAAAEVHDEVEDQNDVSLSNVMQALSADRLADPAPVEAAEADGAEEPEPAVEAETELAETAEADQPPVEAAAAEVADATVAEPLARARARVIKVRRIDPDSAPQIMRDDEDDQEDGTAAAQASEAAATAPEGEDAAKSDTAHSDDDEWADDNDGWDEEPAPPHAVAASAFGASPAEAALHAEDPEEDYEDEGELAGAPVAHAPGAAAGADATGLSPEAESELQAELAAVEREVEAHRRNDRGGRSILSDSADDDDAMSRLMRQTENQMEGAENRRRLSTIAHLKAAVAAKEADHKLGSDDEENLDAALRSYRDDLARVVRPRRPVAGDSSSVQRPAAPADRPAPLVLVSEQRIDRPADSVRAQQPIRPRRISTSNLALNEEDEDDEIDTDQGEAETFADSRSFAEFAERIGASSLSDLLEAAAAYSNCVEGREHFTRPQIMRFAATVSTEGGESDTFSREAGLRSFGALLREGKIKKVKRGQFAISQSSRFISEARKIAR